MPDVALLEVRLHGEPIGTLTLLPGEQSLFAFSQAYIDDDARLTLSLSFKDETGGLITDVRPTRARLPTFFSNLLPEGALREALAARAGVKPSREFFLMWALGRDLPGALTVTAADEDGPPQTGESVAGRDDRPADRPLRFSLAGVQLKFSAVQQASGGLTIPADGEGGSWIVKLPSARFDGVPENEFSMMSLARAVGIDVPEIRLVNPAGIEGLPQEAGGLRGQALAIRRFDRPTEGGAVHIEDFAQVFGVYPEAKYERASYRNIAEVLWAETGVPGIAEFVRRLVFNTLIGNADMHLKNWSLIYPDRRTPAIAPAYDFVSTIAYIPDARHALTLGRSKRMADLSLDELAYLAGKARLPEKIVLDAARETAARVLDAWASERKGLPLAADAAAAIEAHLKTVALVRELRRA